MKVEGKLEVKLKSKMKFNYLSGCGWVGGFKAKSVLLVTRLVNWN